MSSISDFFKKGKPRIFSCGEERSSSKAARLRNKVMIWTMAAMTVAASVGCSQSTLSSVFNSTQTEQADAHASGFHAAMQNNDLTLNIDNSVKGSQRASVKKLFNEALQTKTGRSVLVPFMEHGGVITVQKGMGETFGYYNPSKNTICLNAEALTSVKGKGRIKTTLVHEAAHAKQNYAGLGVSSSSNAGMAFRLARAMEADAHMHEVFAADELAAKGDSSALQAIRGDLPQMVSAFEQARKAGKSDAETAKETMLGYYKNTKLMKAYDAKYVESLENVVNKVGKTNAQKQLQGSMSPSEIAAKTCVLNGESYLGKDGGAILCDSLCNNVSEQVYASLELASHQHAIRLKQSGVSVNADTSYQSFHVRQKDGTYRSPEKSISAGTYKVASLAKEKGGR